MCARRGFPEADAATEFGCAVFMGVNTCDRERGRSRPGQEEKLTCAASTYGTVSCLVPTLCEMVGLHSQSRSANVTVTAMPCKVGSSLKGCWWHVSTDATACFSVAIRPLLHI